MSSTFDHRLPLSDRSMVEASEIAGVKTESIVPVPANHDVWQKALPSTLVRLLLPLTWRVTWTQFLLGAQRA
jgi:hypothetical protein